MFKQHLEESILDATERYEAENKSVNAVTPHPRDKAREITEFVFTGLLRRGYTEGQLAEFTPQGKAMSAEAGGENRRGW